VFLLVPPEDYHWSAVPYFALSGVVGTAAGRLFRVAGIEKVGAPVAASSNNLSPFISAGLAILLLGERVTVPILMGTLVIVLGTVLLSLSGKQVGFRGGHLVYPLLCASCFGVVAVVLSADCVHGCERFTLPNVRRDSPGACAAYLEAICPVAKGAFARLSAFARRIRAPIAGLDTDDSADDLGHR
jgi:hypothetical protein